MRKAGSFLAGLLVYSQANEPPSQWSTGGTSDEDGVEALCDASFLQTSFHTEQVLSTPGQPSSDVRKLAPEVASVGATALSFFQVDEASQSSTGEMVVSKEEIFRGPSAVWSMDRLRTCAWLLKALFVLLFLWKGGSAFTRFLKRRTAPTTSSAATGTTGAAAKGGEAKEDAEVGVVPPESFRKLQLEDPTPKGVPTLTATEVQKLLPAFCGYDCALLKPKSLGRPFRVRARIYGPCADVEPLIAPFSEEVCVLCTTKVELPGEATVILERSESVDFWAILEGAPDVQLMVNAKDVKMCMNTQVKVQKPFESVPKKLQELVEADTGGLRPESSLLLQEELLRVGDLVTLVGDLQRDAAGRLLIWPSHPPAKEMHQVYDLMDGMHVLISDEDSFGAPTK